MFAWLRGPLGRGGRAVRQGPPAAHPDRGRGRRRDRHAQHRRGAERPGPAGRGAADVRGGAARVAGRRVRHRRRLRDAQPRPAWRAAAATSSARRSCTTPPASSSSAMVAESELIDTDARIAEALVFQGRIRGGDRAGVGMRSSGRRPAAAPRRTRCCTASAATRTRSAASGTGAGDELRAQPRGRRGRAMPATRWRTTLDAMARIAEARGQADAAAAGRGGRAVTRRSGSCSSRPCRSIGWLSRRRAESAAAVQWCPARASESETRFSTACTSPF